METRTAFAGASYTTEMAPAVAMLPAWTFNSTPCDGLFGSMVVSLTAACWLAPNFVFQVIGPPACTSNALPAIL